RQVVGELVDLADAPLREDVYRPDALQRAATHRRQDDAGDGRSDLERAGDAARIGRAATAELHADPLVEGAGLVHHRAPQRARPDAAEVLAARGNVAGEAVGLRQGVHEVLLLRLVADGDVVPLRRLHVAAQAVFVLRVRRRDVVLGLCDLEGLAAEGHGAGVDGAGVAP